MKLTIGKKMSIGFVIVILIMLFAIIISIFKMHNSIVMLRSISEKHLKVDLILLNARIYADQEQYALSNILLYNNEKTFKEQLANFRYKQSLRNRCLEEINNLVSSSTISNIVIEKYDELKNLFVQEDNLMEKSIKVYQSEGYEAAVKVICFKLSKSSYLMKEIVSILEREVSQKTKIASKKANEALIIAIFLFILATGLAVFISTIISNKIVTNIRYLTYSADEISLGDLDTPIKLDSNDELGELSSIFEEMRIRLKNTMDKLGKK